MAVINYPGSNIPNVNTLLAGPLSYLQPFIKWQNKASGYHVTEDAKQPYSLWDTEQKAALQKMFEYVWSFTHTPVNYRNPVTYPPVNKFSPITPADKPKTAVEKEYAWPFYLQWICWNMLVEYEKLVSWSLTKFSKEHLLNLFDSSGMFTLNGGLYFIGSAYPEHLFYTNKEDNLGSSLISLPFTAYSFLKANNLIGDTRYKTICLLLQWVSDNFRHFEGGGNDYKTMDDHWQYKGLPPINRMIEGTTKTSTGEKAHWTAGCHGTNGFLRNILRAVNIPVQIIRVCGHSTVYFMSEALYMDHGDDPYNTDFKKTKKPASALLINEATYSAWFGTNHNNPDETFPGCDCSKIGQMHVVLSGK